MRIGFYSGSFDPITLGHADIIARAAGLVDKLVVGIGVHAAKKPMFSAEKREEMVKAVLKSVGIESEVVRFDGLVIEAAADGGATLIIRGLRGGGDFEYEAQMAAMNGTMAEKRGDALETIFLAANPATSHISSTLVRQILAMGGDVSPFVPKIVLDNI